MGKANKDLWEKFMSYYSAVFTEFPTLIEAKALTLAPTETSPTDATPTPSADVVVLLQRPLSMSLRDYISHLSSLGVLTLTPTVSSFLARYEAARFSTRPISNADFRLLMHLFAEVLRAMRPPHANTPDDSSFYTSSSSLRPAATASTTSSRSTSNGCGRVCSSGSTPCTPNSRSP